MCDKISPSASYSYCELGHRGLQPRLAKELVYASVPFSLRDPLNIICRIFINLVNFRSSERNLMRLQPFRLLDQLPAHKDDWKDSDHGARKEEGWNIPLAYMKVGKCIEI